MSTLGTGQLLFTFMRHWSRRAAAGDATIAEQGRLVLATEAVNTLAARHEPATVNAVARELGIDQSGASRMIKTAVAAGYLEMTKGPTDGGSREASMTSEGVGVLESAHAWQELVFTDLAAGWSRAGARASTAPWPISSLALIRLTFQSRRHVVDRRRTLTFD